MFKRIEIQGFRGIRQLEISDLSRVNLFVGRNNSGKTTVLEAAEILAGHKNPLSVMRGLSRRSEIILGRENERPTELLDVSHLFYGHQASADARFTIHGEGKNSVQIHCAINPAPAQQSAAQTQLDLEHEDDLIDGRYALSIISTGTNEPFNYPLIGLSGISMLEMRRRLVPSESTEAPTSYFMPTDGIDGRRLSALWDAVALTQEEKHVIETLRIIDPDVEKIAFLGRENVRYGGLSSGVFVKLQHHKDRIPLGSLGDGMRRLLCMALIMARSAGGYVMIDEIDSGLHHTTVYQMWKMIIGAARRLNIQVFATTHSLDCIRTLARLESDDPRMVSDVSLQRIEKDLSQAIRYSASELHTAVSQDMEIR